MPGIFSLTKKETMANLTEDLPTPTTEKPPFDFSEVSRAGECSSLSSDSCEKTSLQKSSERDTAEGAEGTHQDNITKDKENVSPNIPVKDQPEEPESQEMEVSNLNQVIEKKREEWTYMLSHRTVLKVTPTCQVQFEVGPLIEDPSIVKALLNFPVTAVKKLHPKIESIKKFLLSPDLHTKKEHLCNQWYVQVYVPDQHLQKEPTVNFLSINRKGISNYKISIFLTLDEFAQLSNAFPYLMKEINSHSGLLSSSISTINKKIAKSTEQQEEKGLFYTFEDHPASPPNKPYLFFNKEDAVKYAMEHSLIPLEPDQVKVKEVYATPPSIINFLKNCLYYITYKNFVNYVFVYNKENPQKLHPTEHQKFLYNYATEHEFTTWVKHVHFPVNFLEICFSSFYLAIGLLPPKNMDKCMNCVSPFLHPHLLRKELFVEEILNLNLDCTPGEEMLMKQLAQDLYFY